MFRKIAQMELVLRTAALNLAKMLMGGLKLIGRMRMRRTGNIPGFIGSHGIAAVTFFILGHRYTLKTLSTQCGTKACGLSDTSFQSAG